MNTLFGVGIVFHSFLFLFSIGIFFYTSRANRFSSLKIFLPVSIISTLMSIFIIKAGAGMIQELAASKMALMGYAGFPILTPLYMLLSYPIVTIINQKTERKLNFGLVFLGLMLGAPLTFLFAVLLTMLGLS